MHCVYVAYHNLRKIDGSWLPVLCGCATIYDVECAAVKNGLTLQEEGGMMMNEILFLVEESAEGGYEARALGESIYTEADDLPSLRQMIADAVECHFDETNRPKIIRLHFVHEEVFAL